MGDLTNWQKALAADFKNLHQTFPESFMRASGAMAVNDKEVHASRVSFSDLAVQLNNSEAKVAKTDLAEFRCNQERQLQALNLYMHLYLRLHFWL